MPPQESLATLSDEQLIERVRGEDDAALHVLVERHLKSVYRFCLRYTGSSEDAEDAAQEAFLKAWRNLGRYDSGKPFKTWLFAIAKNSATDLMRKRKSVTFSMLDSGGAPDSSFSDTLADPEDLPDEVFARSALAQEVQTAMSSLKARERTILSLRYEEGESFEDIARILSIPANTVRSLHRRALSTMRAFFEQAARRSGGPPGKDASDS